MGPHIRDVGHFNDCVCISIQDFSLEPLHCFRRWGASRHLFSEDPQIGKISSEPNLLSPPSKPPCPPFVLRNSLYPRYTTGGGESSPFLSLFPTTNAFLGLKSISILVSLPFCRFCLVLDPHEPFFLFLSCDKICSTHDHVTCSMVYMLNY